MSTEFFTSSNQNNIPERFTGVKGLEFKFNASNAYNEFLKRPKDDIQSTDYLKDRILYLALQ